MNNTYLRRLVLHQYVRSPYAIILQSSEDFEIFGQIVTNLNDVKFPNLTRLMICDNNLTSLDGIELLPNIYDLNVSGNKISSLNSLKLCTNLKFLDITRNDIMDFSPLNKLPGLRLLQCDIRGNLYKLHKYPNLTIYISQTNKYISNDPYVQILAYREYIKLLHKYNELIQYSKSPEFTKFIVNIKEDEGISIFESLDKLEIIYERLLCAPHGPVFNEGLKFFVP